MKRLITLTAALLAFGAAPTAAQAASDLAPTAAQAASDLQIAKTYWNTVPACGWPTISQAPLGLSIAGEADLATCQIFYSSAMDWRDFPSQTCQVAVHEYGHLVLGLDYFASVNPSDPEHSPDPNSIMYYKPNFSATLAWQVGCPLGEFAPHGYADHQRFAHITRLWQHQRWSGNPHERHRHHQN